MTGLVPGLDFLAPASFEPVGFVPDRPPTFEDVPLFDDVRPVSAPPEMTSSDTRLCDVCGEPLPPQTGGGRRRKRHVECAPARGTSTPRARVSKDRSQRVADQLMTGMGELAGGFGAFLPVTGAVIGLRAERTVNALVAIGEIHPKFMDGLEKAAMAMPYIDVGATAGAIVYAMGVDVGRLSPDTFVAANLGVARAAEMVGYSQPQEDEASDWTPPNLVEGALTPAPAFRAVIPE